MGFLGISTIRILIKKYDIREVKAVLDVRNFSQKGF